MLFRSGGVYRSEDGANSWKKINTGLIPETELMGAMALGVNAIVFDPVTPDTVYAGTTKGLFRTANGGASWERIGDGLKDPFVSSLLINPAQPSQLYLGGPGGVWKSLDSGKTWQAMNAGLTSLNIRSLAMSPKNPQDLFVGTNGSGLYHSTDGGTSWTPMPLKAAPAQ